MIRATFYKKEKSMVSCSVTGHADFGPYGEDIVCAGVSSAVQLTANGITQVLQVPAQVTVQDNLISIALPNEAPLVAASFLEALYLQLSLLQEEYPDYIKITLAEV